MTTGVQLASGRRTAGRAPGRETRSEGTSFGPAGAESAVPRRHTPRIRLRSEELARLATNLALQLRAGISLVRALEVQVDEDAPPSARTGSSALIPVVVRSLHTGTTFADSLAEQPAVPKLMVSMVRAGEASGRLPETLEAVARHLTWSAEISKSLRKAMTYPVMVLLACGGLLLLILGVLMPGFEPMFERVDDELPVQSQLLRAASRFVHTNWLEILTLSCAGVAALAVFLRIRTGRRLLARCGERMPWIGATLGEIDLARLLRNLAVLLDAGLPLARSLQLAEDSVSTLRLRRGLRSLRSDLDNGSTFREASRNAGVLSRLSLNLIAVGEESGSLVTMLDHAADHHAVAFRDRVDRGMKFLEPAITLVLGVVVGGIAMTIVTTLYKAILLAGR